MLCSAQASFEGFHYLNASATSYTDGAFVGDNGSLWTYAGVRSVRNQFAIEGTSLGFGDQVLAERYLQTFIGEQGIGDLSFQMRSYFTAGSAEDRSVTVYVNDAELGTQSLQVMNTVETFRLQGVDIEGPLLLRIEASGPRQIVIDNIQWTPVPPPSPAPAAAEGLNAWQSGPTSIQVSWQAPNLAWNPRGFLLVLLPLYSGSYPGDGTPPEHYAQEPGVHYVSGSYRSWEITGLQPGVIYTVQLIPFSNGGSRVRYTAQAQISTFPVQLVPIATWPVAQDPELRAEQVLRDLLGYPPGPDELQFWLHRLQHSGNFSVWLEDTLRMPHLIRQYEFLAAHFLWWGYFPNTRYWFIDVNRDLYSSGLQGLTGLATWLANTTTALPQLSEAEQFVRFWRHRHGMDPTLPQRLQASTRMQSMVTSEGTDPILSPSLQLFIDLTREIPGALDPVIAEPPNARWFLLSRLALLVYHFWPYAHGAASVEFLNAWAHRSLEDFLSHLQQHPHYLHRHQFYWLGSWPAGEGFALPGVGWFWYDEQTYPWIWFPSVGWTFAVPGANPETETFLWHGNDGWFYWNRNWLPWMFNFAADEWRYGW